MRNLELVRAIKSGETDKYNELIEINEGLVKYLIKKYFTNHLAHSYEGLLQAGRIAIFKSVDKYDESFGTKFSTYVAENIINEIKTTLTENKRQDYAVTMPRKKVILMNRIKKLEEEYKCKNNKTPTYDELGVSKEEYDDYKYNSEMFYKEQLFFEVDGSEYVNELIPPNYDEYSLNDSKEWFCFEDKKLNDAYCKLNDREKLIMKYIIKDNLKFREVSEILGLSKQGVNATYIRACEKIKKSVGEDYMKNCNFCKK